MTAPDDRASRRNAIAANVRSAAAWHQLNTGDLAGILKLSRATLRGRLNGKSDFSVTELALLAERFRMTVGDLTDGRLRASLSERTGEINASPRRVS